MKKIVRINLKERRYQLTALPEVYLNLGGRALSSSLIAREVPAASEALGSQNKLVIAAGILAGTSVPNSGRLSIGAKSPLTGTIKEANAGGSAAQKLARLGIQAVVLEEAASELLVVKIDKDGVHFFPAAGLSMLGNLNCFQACRQMFGERVGIISIGPAGEMGLLASAVAVSSPDFQPRMAARGGLGAVMGAKKVKAFVIDDAGGISPEVKNAVLFNAAVKVFTQGIVSHPLTDGLKQFGTAMLVGIINEIGGMATRNYSIGRFYGAARISGESLVDLLKGRPNAKTSHCCMPNCVMNCSNIFTDKQGQVVVSGLDYDTIALMGSNCLIDDLDTIAMMKGVCNDAGADAIEVGGALAVAMEAGLLPWGDRRRALELVREISLGTERGRMIGNGCRYAGEKLGASRIPHVKGQCLAGYDPRVFKGTGVTYATATMGADHTCGNALPSLVNPAYNPSARDGQWSVSQFLQRYCAAIDSLGLCLFASLPALYIPELQKHLIECASAVLDETLTADYLMRLGGTVLGEERKFNRAAGFSEKDDRLPDFFTKEALVPGGGKFDIGDADLDRVHP